MNTWIVIPAFHEEKKIAEVVMGLQKENYQNIAVIDDGSNDNTSKIATEAGAVVLRHLVNRGQGAALKTGLDYSLKNGADFIVTFDSDGQHQPQDIKKLLQPLQEGRAEVVLGSRFLDSQSNTPFVRKVFLKGGAVIMNSMYNVKLTDSHNGLRAFSRNAALKLNLTQDRMEHASEIIEEIGKHKLKYMEVPVTITYTDYSLQHGQKTSNAFKIFVNMIFKKIIQ